MKKNPWNIKMIVEFDENHKKNLLKYYKTKGKGDIDTESINYLRDKYNEGYGLKALARSLDLTYTRIRTLFRYLNIDIRKGRNVVTDKVRKFRSERVKGERSPWYDWPSRYPKMQKSCSRGIQGYYKKKDGSYVYLRSSWEYIMAKWLDKQNIDWKYELKLYKLSNGENYRPDFFIFKNNELKMIIEVKGYYKDRAHKIDVLRRDKPDIKVVQITDISKYSNKSEKMGRDEWLKERLLEKE